MDLVDADSYASPDTARTRLDEARRQHRATSSQVKGTTGRNAFQMMNMNMNPTKQAQADSWDGVDFDAERARDLQIQIDVVRKQVAAKEESLRSMQDQLTEEEEVGKHLQKELAVLRKTSSIRQRSPSTSAGDIELQTEWQVTTDAKSRLSDAQMSFSNMETKYKSQIEQLQRALANATKPQRSAEDSIQAVRQQMNQRLSEVQTEMEQQFVEEREKLEGRLEFLTRLNERKDAEIESQQIKKGEIANMLNQCKDAHRIVIEGCRTKFEHENKQALRHETNVSRLEREVRMKNEECNKLRERIRKAGGGVLPPPAVSRIGSSPSASRKRNPITPKRYS
eukprot:TRINITY_DN19734_c0_g1_i2.p1 TRINITY_DN19734_c0_g1~~TRINITY_DN19734_c0_g1_i2.p1  ORF type:complete len:338 (+),score=81.03 TRINITY_DN19734_c0_g1_i2:48-1061(+)